MAGVGPTGYKFNMDLVQGDHSRLEAGAANLVPDDINADPGANTELPRITEFSGIDETGVTTDLTALGDRFRSKGPIGVSEFAQLRLRGYVDVTDAGVVDPASAHKRIGTVPKTSRYPRRKFRCVHVTGLAEQLHVTVIRNRRIPSKDNQLMFEALLENASREEGEYKTRGI